MVKSVVDCLCNMNFSRCKVDKKKILSWKIIFFELGGCETIRVDFYLDIIYYIDISCDY